MAMSQTLEESKERHVFICEYNAPQKSFNINDTLKINVKKAYLEQMWFCGSNPNNKKDMSTNSGYQLIIETESEADIKDYSRSWYIGISPKAYIRCCGKVCLMSDFELIPGYTLIW